MKFKFDSWYLKNTEFWVANVTGTLFFFGMAAYWYMNGNNPIALFSLFMWLYAIVGGAMKCLISVERSND